MVRFFCGVISLVVVTVEPGVYLPGRFGVRIEDMVLITEDEPEIMSRVEYEERLII